MTLWNANLRRSSLPLTLTHAHTQTDIKTGGEGIVVPSHPRKEEVALTRKDTKRYKERSHLTYVCGGGPLHTHTHTLSLSYVPLQLQQTRL